MAPAYSPVQQRQPFLRRLQGDTFINGTFANTKSRYGKPQNSSVVDSPKPKN